jgi:hypothetical protein
MEAAEEDAMDRHSDHPTHEILVVDSSEQASLALSARTPAGETNHLLCRHPNEPWASFTERVEHRVSRVCRSAKSSRLCYFLSELDDAGATSSRGTLIAHLARSLNAGCSLRFVSLGAPRSEVDGVLDALLPALQPGVRVDAEYVC